jgi:cell wall-associated NlpC family hydrolase
MRGVGLKARVLPRRRHRVVWLIVLFASSIIAALAISLLVNTEARALSPGQDAYVDVQAATLWSEPYQARRDVDRPSYADRTDLTLWERRMTQSQKYWLIGRTQTQALYGEEVRVLDTYGRWVKVAVKSQATPKSGIGYPGWMPEWQLTTRRDADLSRGELMAQVESKYGLLYLDRGLDRVDHSVSYGTRLPVTGRAPGRVHVADPDGGNLWVSAGQVRLYREGRVRERARPTPEKIRREALKFRGTPYVWAGTASYGLDCSGFTYLVYRKFGIEIPRDAGDQRRAGSYVGWHHKEPGDLVFFGPSSSNTTHVAMYIGDGRMIHASYGNGSVRVERVGDSGLMGSYQGVRRMR